MMAARGPRASPSATVWRALPGVAALLILLAPLAGAQPTVSHRADLIPGGDGFWTIETRYPIESPLDERAWNATAANLTPASPEFRRMAEGLRASLGVPGALLDVSREEAAGRANGVVRVRFPVPGLLDSGGRFSGLPGGTPLGPGDSLTVRFPAALVAGTVYPPPDRRGEGFLAWSGPRDLGPGEPLVVLQSAGSSAWSAAVLAGAAAVCVAMLVVLLHFRRRK